MLPALSTAITGGPGESCAAGLLTLPAFPATFPCATMATVPRCLGRQMRCDNERPFQPGGRLSAVRARGYSSGALPFSLYAGDYRLWGEKSQFWGRRGEQSVVAVKRWVGTVRRWLVSMADLMGGSRAGTRPAPTGSLEKKGHRGLEGRAGTRPAPTGPLEGEGRCRWATWAGTRSAPAHVRSWKERRSRRYANGGRGTWWNDGTGWTRDVVGEGALRGRSPRTREGRIGPTARNCSGQWLVGPYAS